MRKGIAIAATVLALGGCKKKQDDGGGNVKADTPTAQAPQLLPTGMDDPFARLTGDGVKQLNAGYKALKGKKYDEARAAFEEVGKTSPDYSPARYQAVRATALGGKFADVPDAWARLIARDFVAYAGKLDKPKDMAPLRASPEWAKVKKAEDDYRAAYAKGLQGGFFFVARTRDAEPLKWNDAMQATLDVHQEAFHYDPATQKYRRLTETDGHVYAIALAPDKKALSFVAARKLAKEGDAEVFSDPEVGYVNLATLETVGPFKIQGTSGYVDLRFSQANEPLFAAQSKQFVVDSAKTGITPAEGVSSVGGVTSATPANVHRTAAAASGVAVSPDHHALTIEGSATPIRAARELDDSSLEWSPGKKRLTYAGKIDACKLLNVDAKEKNELFVWDGEKKAASRVAAAVSYFDTLWLDDDKLVYEGGIGKDGKLHVVDLPTRNDTVLKPRYGAGLFGFPTLVCEPAADEPPATDAIDAEGDEPEGD